MTEKKIVYEPAVLPLYAVEVNIPVRALRKKGKVERGSDYHIGLIRRDGKVHLIAATPGDWYDMDMFVQLLHPKAENDNAPSSPNPSK